MTERDSQRVIDTLKKERKIEQSNDSLFYDLDYYTLYLDSYFKNYDLKITYVTNDYYKTEQGQKLKSENERKKLDKRIEEANKSESKRRRNEALNDI